MKTPTKLDPNDIKVRDPLMVRLICGATKANTQTDRKKDQDLKACRHPVDRDEE